VDAVNTAIEEEKETKRSKKATLSKTTAKADAKPKNGDTPAPVVAGQNNKNNTPNSNKQNHGNHNNQQPKQSTQNSSIPANPQGATA
jgi:hypothetical protein